MAQNKFPPGWDDKRVQSVLAHYDKQTDEDASAEDDQAFEHSKTTLMAIPMDLVPEVRKLLAKRNKAA
jgi:hypothetical protein